MESCEKESVCVCMSVVLCVSEHICAQVWDSVHISLIIQYIMCMSVHEYVYVYMSVRWCVFEYNTACSVNECGAVCSVHCQSSLPFSFSSERLSLGLPSLEHTVC